MNSQAAVAPLPQSIPQTPESGAAHRQTLRLTPAAADKRPRWIWRVVQWKYDVDESSKWLKKLYFRFVFLKFNEFSYWAFDLLPPNGKDDTGRLCWTEDQGCHETEWEAEQEAMNYRFGHAVKVPFHASLCADTVNTEQVHPNSPREVRKMYEKKTTVDEIGVPRLDLVQLAAQLERNKPLLARRNLTVT